MRHFFQRCHTVTLCLIITVCALVGAACSRERESKKILSVSIPAQKWLLDSIVGSRYEVMSMLSADANPETFEPSMKQLMDLQHSEAYFTVGNLAFELASMDKIRENIPGLKVYDSSQGIAPLAHTHSTAANGGEEEQAHDHDHDMDPHVWSSLTNARVMARNMYEKVVALDPDGINYYTQRFQDLDRNLAALNDSVAAVLAPLKGRTFLLWHPSLSYFARDYSLVQAPMETTGKETSIAQYKARLDFAAKANALLFFTQAEFDSRQANAMAQELGVPAMQIALMKPDIAAQIRFITNELNKARNRTK